MSQPTKPRLLVLNQYYWPGIEATAQLLTDLCEALAEDFHVTVVTGRLWGRPELPRREWHNGVRILRVPSAALDRSRLSWRAANYLTYLAGSLAHGLSRPRPDIVLCMTDPPIVGNAALVVARRFRCPLLVVSEDVFPEIAVELKRLENPLLVRLLGVLTRFYLTRADRVVAIGRTMERRLEDKGVSPKRVRVIPNWVDTRDLTPRPRDNEWARTNDLVGKFVVMHSGNIGHAQDLENLIRATTFLRDLDGLESVLIGFGARHAEMVLLAERLAADRVRFLPYQERVDLPWSLSSADVHFVGLGRGLSGYIVPSRLYGVLAVARPVIAAADEESETAQLVRETECGVVVPPGRPDLLARVLRELVAGEHDLDAMGRRGREYVEAEADRLVAIGRYRDVLSELTAAG